jgi:hypothetical protein
MTKFVANFTEKQAKEFHEPYDRLKVICILTIF